MLDAITLYPWEVLSYIGIGVLAGFFAGLLGIGGGAIIGPLLILLFIGGMGFSQEYAVHMAVATASGVIVFTAFASAITHARRGNVDWRMARLLTIGAVLGGWAGAHSAAALPAVALKLLLVGFLLVSTFSLLKPENSGNSDNSGVRQENPAAAAAISANRLLPASFVIGIVSAMLGIGGGAMTVPYLHHCGVFIRRAIGTSAFLGFPLGAAATIGYIGAGSGVEGLPAASVGYIYLPALLCISVFSIGAAYAGARMSHALPAAGLRKIFALLLLLISARLVFAVYEGL